MSAEVGSCARSRVRPGGRLAAHRDRRPVAALGPEPGAVGGRDARTREPGRAGAERAEQGCPVGGDIAAQRPLAEQVRAQQPERARVRQRRADASAHADAGRVAVEAAERRQPPAGRELVPAPQVIGGWTGGDGRLGVA
jgi:hypothetical protein